MNMMLPDAISELKLAARALAKRPAYAAVAAFTLALGIGANMAIFTVVNAVLIRPLQYPDSDRIVEVRHHAPGLNMPELQNSPGLIESYRRSSRTLTRMAGYDMRRLNLAGSGSPERIRAVAVTPELFEVLATRPRLGRPFYESDVSKGAPLVTILTHALWQSRFGSDPGVIGRTVQLDGRAAEIVGVMPQAFVFPDAETRLLVPLPLDPTAGFGSFGTESLARLQAGVTLDAAQREIHALQRRIPEWFPDLTADLLKSFGWSASVAPLRDRVVAGVSSTLWILFGTVGLVLLIAGANVANLFLVRAESRQREVAVRSALGASRSRIAGTFVAESFVLAAVGGAAGFLMAAAGTRLLVAYGPAQLPRLHEVRMDATVFAFGATLTLLCAVVLGILPTLSIARRPIATMVREGGRASTAGRGRHRVRQLLIVAQVAMALVLLVGAGLMLRSAARLNAVDPGFRADGLLTAGVSLGAQSDRARAVTFYHRVLDEVATLPGVASVGAASSLPIAPSAMNGSSFEIRSRPTADNEIPLFSMYISVTAGFFETLGVPLLRGRAPARSDADQGPAVAWVNATFARQFLNDRAIGESIKIQDTWFEIVGVVGDVRMFGLREDIRPMAYLPLNAPPVALDVMHAVIRTDGAPASLATALREAVDRVDASVPLTTARTMSDIIDESLAQASFTIALLAIAAIVALVLGIVGLYGVISYIVTERTAEIGVRLALGAEPSRVRIMVLRQGVTVAVVGVIVGLVAAFASTRLMASLVFEVSTHDPITFATVAAALTAVSALATYLPARRAAAIDPLHALREQG
jgi:putative ABC transport system permease protein